MSTGGQKDKRAILITRAGGQPILVEVTGEPQDLGIRLTKMDETVESFRERETKEQTFTTITEVTLPVGQTVTVDELEITLSPTAVSSNFPKEPTVRHIPGRPYYLGPQNRKTKRY